MVDEGHPRQEARHDAGLRRGDRRRRRRHGDRGGALPGRHRAHRRRPTATTPSSSRSSRSPTASSRRASSATCARRASAGTGTSSSSAARASSRWARAVTVEAFEPGDRIKVSGTSIGKGFQGTIKRHNFTPRPDEPRLAQRPQAGLDRRVGDAVARLQGQEDGRPHGRASASRSRASSSTRSTPSATSCSSGRRPGAEERARRDPGGGALMAVKAAVLGGQAKDVALDAAVFEAEVKPHLVHETVRAELNAARRGHARREEPRARRRRPREAVAPEGHGPRPPGHDPRAAVHGRRRRVPARDAQLRRQGEPQGAPRRAPRRALATTRRTARSRCSTGASFDAPSTKQAKGVLEAWGKDAPVLVVAHEDEEAVVKSFRNLERVLVTVPAELEVAAIVWARAVLVTEAALPLVEQRPGRRRRRERSDERAGRAGAGRLREELLGDRRPAVHVQGPSGRAQDAGAPGGRGAVRRARRAREHRQGAVRSRSAAASFKGTRPGWKKAIVQVREGETIEIFEGAQV